MNPKIKKILLAFIVFLFTAVFAKISPVFSQPKQEFAQDQVIVKFQAGVNRAKQAKIHAKAQAQVKKQIGNTNAFVVNVARGRVKEKVRVYEKNPQVEYAEPNYIVKALDIPDDPYFSDQWHYNNTGQLGGLPDADIDLQEAWNLDYQNARASVRIAILDTGIDQDHEDLAGKIDLNANFSSSSTHDDLYGHGTHCAGIASAYTNNAIGVAGTGYDNGILLLNGKVLDDRARGYHSDIADGIYWAIDNGADVISMSIGSNSGSQTLKDAIDSASANIVLVAAAGNSNDATATYPAFYNGVIAVAATTNTDQKADFSSFGDWVQVAAPGENIFSTFPNHDFVLGRGRNHRDKNYDYGSGTSMSTPMVAGLAGQIILKDEATRQEVWETIKISCDQGILADYGIQWGRINACNALGGNCAYGEDPSPSPSPSPSSEPSSSPSPSPEPSESPLDCSDCHRATCDGKCHPIHEGSDCPDCW